MMESTEYTALSSTSSGKNRQLWKWATMILLLGFIGTMVYFSTSLERSSHSHHVKPHASSFVETETETEYVFSQLVSEIQLENEINSFIKAECSFGNGNNNNNNDNNNKMIDSSNYNEYLSKLFGQNDLRSTQYHVSKIVKPKYNVEWIFGNSIDLATNENEHFVIVLQIDLKTSEIFEMNVFSSKYNDESAESLHRRLFNAFDFNKNGELCITEFPSMVGAVSGFGSIEMSNNILLSFMNNDLETHIKFTETEYINNIENDVSISNIADFSELRHSIQNSMMDGYFAMVESSNNNGMNCYYFDLSWNCDENNEYYSTYNNNDELSKAVYRVSDSIFANVCCSMKQ